VAVVMAELGINERIKVWRLATGAAARAELARALSSRLLRWRYGAPVAGEIALVPQELRAADPSFSAEVAAGQMGLAGRIERFWSKSPFDIEAPSADWGRALHGFGWLRHLRADKTPEAAGVARVLVGQWLARSRTRDPLALEPAVAGRRIISWLANADLILTGTDAAAFDRTVESLAEELISLSATWRAAPAGLPRLVATTALVYGNLCIAGHQHRLAAAEKLLARELGSQFLADGGHVSRNPEVLVEIMLDLLPLRQCFATAGRPFPADIENAMARMLRMLHFMRLGDGSLARFNGVGASPVAELATVLAYDASGDNRMKEAPNSGYARLECGRSVLIVDVGIAPPLEHAGRAMAGCLSLELSMGALPIFVNGGMPGPMEDRLMAVARSTASHNTLTLGDKSTSARRLRGTQLARIAGGEPLVLNGTVSARQSRDGEDEVLEASHTAYVAEHGLLYSRTLRLAGDGMRIEGVERLAGPRRTLRLKRDVPYAVRFHLAPQVGCEPAGEAAVSLRLRDGTLWRFEAAGADLSIEPSTHYASLSGMVASRQIVLRGSCFGETELSWSLGKSA
jgi:uncharacterized heparinase superfamily protein